MKRGAVPMDETNTPAGSDYEDSDWYEEDCYECEGEGFVLNECFEDTCCCADPELQHGYRICPVCRGKL